jgi:hypothetical protein
MNPRSFLKGKRAGQGHPSKTEDLPVVSLAFSRRLLETSDQYTMSHWMRILESEFQEDIAEGLGGKRGQGDVNTVNVDDFVSDKVKRQAESSDGNVTSGQAGNKTANYTNPSNATMQARPATTQATPTTTVAKDRWSRMINSKGE